MAERNAGLPQDKRIEFRIGIHQGDIVIERGDIFGDGVNVAARLQTLAEPGGICVSARVQEDARGKFDIPLEDTGEQQLKNIARPVRVYRIRPSDPATSSPCSSPLSDMPMVSSPIAVVPLRLRRMLGARHVRTALMTALVLLTTSGGAAYWYLRRGEPQPQEHRLSIVVLPFTNLSNEPEQDYFAEALTDDLSADLSRIQDSFVIAPNTARAYKNVDPKRAGRELGVRYVLDGSLRRTETMVRIHPRLIDAGPAPRSGRSASTATGQSRCNFRTSSPDGWPGGLILN